jgi:signal transduction histidine kinase
VTTDDERSALATAAFDALPAQVAVLDDDGEILATNLAWRSFGEANDLAEAEMVGENYLAACDAADDPDAAAAADGIRAVLSGERETFTLEYPCHSPDERRWFTMRAIALPGGDRVLVMHTDITERKLAELRVESHNDRLEAVAGVLSHDLRNPLNVALARADGLAADPDDPDQVREAAAAITTSLERMTDIIEDAVILAAETDPEEVEPVVLDRVARRAWSHVETGEAELAFADPPTVAADASLLVQLLENLVRNAVEHAGPDATVTVGALDGGFFVEDDGPGVPAEDREQVFETGYTTNAAGGGTGMGLAIVGRIADAHGWDVYVSESESGGARFAVTGVAVE